MKKDKGIWGNLGVFQSILGSVSRRGFVIGDPKRIWGKFGKLRQKKREGNNRKLQTGQIWGCRWVWGKFGANVGDFGAGKW